MSKRHGALGVNSRRAVILGTLPRTRGFILEDILIVSGKSILNLVNDHGRVQRSAFNTDMLPLRY